MDKNREYLMRILEAGGSKEGLTIPLCIKPSKNLQDFNEVMNDMVIEDNLQKTEMPRPIVGYNLSGEPSVLQWHNIAVIKKSPITLIKEKLSEGLIIPNKFQKKLRISIEYTKFYIREKRYIACRAAAQVLGFKKQFCVKRIKDEILKNEKISELLEIKKYFPCINSPETRGRSLENIIRVMNPYYEKNKKQRSKKKRIKKYDEIVLIPGIYKSKTKQINFQKLLFALTVLTKVLALQDNFYNEIIKYPIIKRYKNLLPSTFEEIINSWIRDALKKSGSLFSC